MSYFVKKMRGFPQDSTTMPSNNPLSCLLVNIGRLKLSMCELFLPFLGFFFECVNNLKCVAADLKIGEVLAPCSILDL